MLHLNNLGYSATELSNLGFGAWGIGGTAYGPTDDEVSRAALRDAFERGISFFDTADVYGNGHSELLIGQTLGRFREAITIASKVGFNFYDGTGRPTFDPEYIRSCCHKSLARLQTHYIDVYQLHNPPPSVIRNPEVLQTLIDLQHEGKIRVPAVSVSRAEDAFAVLQTPGYGAIQIIYNLIDQRPQALGILTQARSHGVGIIARVPLAYGFLTGKYQTGHAFGRLDHRARRSSAEVSRYLHRAATFQSLIDDGLAANMTELALRFCISHEGVTSVIPGLKTPEQVQAAVHAISRGPLPGEALVRIHSAGLAWAHEDTHLSLA
ncbi:MAG: Aldo-keto reductase YhdN [bacterium]|nr:Aldo-keto reductase YhdN [bacterium]